MNDFPAMRSSIGYGVRRIIENGNDVSENVTELVDVVFCFTQTP